MANAGRNTRASNSAVRRPPLPCPSRTLSALLAGKGQLIQALAQRYRDAGITDLQVNLYPEARHEVFNETNRDEITADVAAWLAAHS